MNVFKNCWKEYFLFLSFFIVFGKTSIPDM